MTAVTQALIVRYAKKTDRHISNTTKGPDAGSRSLGKENKQALAERMTARITCRNQGMVNFPWSSGINS